MVKGLRDLWWRLVNPSTVAEGEQATSTLAYLGVVILLGLLLGLLCHPEVDLWERPPTPPVITSR